jgi:hypothetical protein
MPAIILFRLTLKNIITDIPHDLSAFVTYGLLLLFVAFVIQGSRSGARPDDEPRGPDPSR